MSILPEPRVLILQALGFLVVLLILWKFLFKAAREILDARQREVGTYYSAAEEDRKAAEELKAEYEKHLVNVEAEMRAKITEAAKEGQVLREEIIAESHKQAEAVLTRAKEEIEREKDKAVLEIKTRVADLAIGAAAKLIEERLDDQKHRQLVEKYVDDLSEVAK